MTGGVGENASGGRWIRGVVRLWAGPWAAPLLNFPNPDKIFSLPLALGLTLAMAFMVALYFKREWRAAVIIPYAVVASVWNIVGYWQLLNFTG